MFIDPHHWTTWTTLYLAFEWAVRLVMLVWVPTRRSPESAKGWLLLIFFLPVVGLALYYLIGRPDMPRWYRQRQERVIRKMQPVIARLRSHPNVIHPDLGIDRNQAVTLAENVGHFPILDGNAAEFLSSYQGSIDRLVADIDSARHHVHLLYYIFAKDEVTEPVIAALARAVERGVQCRVLIDALGSRKFAGELRPALRAAGVAMHEMLRTGLFRRLRTRTDLRNHRKIAVIDGRIGFTGSQNLIRPQFKEGLTYEELVVRVTGPIVLALQFVFASDWFLETEEVLESNDFFPEPVLTGRVPAQALPSGPAIAQGSTQRVVIALIHSARQRVVVTTPYFIPDAPMQNALQVAALRGVDVHLVVSEQEDQFLVGQAQKSYYEDLLDSGVQIHLFQREFLHAKHISIDDDIVLVGSSNMDIRSFVLNAEISLLFYDRGVAAELVDQQLEYFRGSRLLNLAEWKQRGFFARFSQNICRLLSPLL